MSGLESGRMFVPAMMPRPELSELERQDLINRPAGDGESIAGLVQSLKGDDATVEIIVGRGRLLTLNEPLADAEGDTPSIAVGDPTVLDFDVLPNSRMIRLLGKRVGMTDLSIVTGNGKAYNFEVQVVYDLNLLRAYLKQLYPESQLKIAQIYEHIVLEGEAPSVDQSNQIVQTTQAYLTSAQVPRQIQAQTQTQPNARTPVSAPSNGGGDGDGDQQQPDVAAIDTGAENKPNFSAALPPPRIINLIRVPGIQQIMLQVRVAELNRTAFRRAGSDWLYRDSAGRTFGSVIGGQNFNGDDGGFLGLALGTSTTAFAIIPNGQINWLIQCLRNNQIINILAEPNLVAMHGQPASFLAGGEFPVPVPQQVGAAGTGIFTIEYKEFGVLLNFVPYIMQNGAIRLHVAPEVSTIDQATGISANGFEIPGINTRRANTTVELHQGQTLALAGLLQVELEGSTSRLPGMGDLPYLGTFFSNTSHERVEKELIILVTPYMVDAMDPQEIGCLPGQEVRDPDDKEFYLMNRIESRVPNSCYRATEGWHDNHHSGVDRIGGAAAGTCGPNGCEATSAVTPVGGTVTGGTVNASSGGMVGPFGFSK